MFKIDQEKIHEAMNEAHKAAGPNAYFGNGFLAGANFATDQINDMGKNPINKRFVSIPCIGRATSDFLPSGAILYNLQVRPEYVTLISDLKTYVPVMSSVELFKYFFIILKFI